MSNCDHPIQWVDYGDGIHDKGMATWHDDDGYHTEVFVRRKPQLPSIEDPQAIVFTNLDYLRTFGHDD